MENFTLQPILGPLVLTLVVLAALAILMVGPSFAKVDGRKRITLTLLRLGVMAMAFLAVLRPGCVQKIEKNQAAVLMFLVDTTRSMELPHITDDSSRWGTLVDTLNENEDRFKQLADKKIDVKFYQFDNQSQPLEIIDGVVQLPESPDGSETDIGSAIYKAGLEVRDRRMVGVFVMTDGVQNVLDPEFELLEAANSLRDMEVPLMAVQLGIPGETGQIADVAITSFAEQQVVNKKSDLISRTTLISRGYANQDITVHLIVSDGEEEKIVATEFVRPSENYEEIEVKLKYRPEEPGEFRLSVRAEPMADELALRNNSLDGFLTVRDEGMRVLFLSGAPNWEQNALARALPALEFLDMDIRFIYPDARSRQNWPLMEYKTEFSDPKKYDVFILSNVDSRALYDHAKRAGPLDELASAVAAGKGLLMLGGSHSFEAGMYQSTPLADVLPIKMAPGVRQDFGTDVRTDLHVTKPFGLRPTQLSRDHFLTNISEGQSNREAWRELPPLLGANRITKKITAQVFLESDDATKHPIMIAGVPGGRVIAFAGDSTWRWKMYGFEKRFDKFWRQIVLWLAKWDSRDGESVSIDLPKRRFAPKSSVKFGVKVNSVSGEKIENVEFNAELVMPNGKSERVSIRQAAEQYDGKIDPQLLAAPGVYRLRVGATHDGEGIGISEREFVVIDRDKEKSNSAANPEQMARLANQTSEFGGRAIEPSEVATILDEYIVDPPMKKIEVPTKWRIGESMTDASIYLLLFVGLLTVEWFLRKKWGLV